MPHVSAGTPRPDHDGRQRVPDRDPAAVEAIIRRTRWLGAALTCVQFALYVAPLGTQLPFSRWWGALPAGLLIGLNLEGLRRVRRGTAGRPGWALFQVVGDSVVISLLIGMFTFDHTSALWTLMIMPVLEAAVRGWSRRALVVFGVLASAYAVREVVATFVIHRSGGTLDSVTYRIGILGIMATATATLAGRLARQIVNTATAQAEADQLRDLAVATRRMSSLDVPTVVREVTLAAEAFGFTDVRLRSRRGVLLGHPPDGGDTWRHTPEWFEATAAATEDSGYVVLGPDRAGVPLAPSEVLVAAAVTAGSTVEALLVGRWPAPVDHRHAEGLALLAAQASAALGNALRFEEGRAYEHRLTYQATHDSLTGLPNRVLLRERAREALVRGARHGTLTAVMYLDLDRFKEINDVLGHPTGDKLLQQVAARILARLEPQDTCARVGGDEFVVVTGDHRDATPVIDLARSLRGVLTESFGVDGIDLDIEASIGLAWAPAHGDDVDVLLRRADVAMYAAKKRNEGVVVYSEVDDRLTPLHLTTLGDLRRALEAQNQLMTHFQPIVELAGCSTGGRLTGVEALVRWDHPVRGMVQPDDFIPVAEGTSVIHQITDRVLQLALGSLQEWSARGLEIDLAVNVSARALLDVSFGQRLAGLLESSGAPASALRLEITESTLLTDPARAVVTMHRLRDLGVRLSIDDFGTGYSSMSYLKTLPLDEIKIDRSFVTDMVRSTRDEAVVRSVVNLAHSLGLRVVAEGVEDQQILEAIAGTGCDMAQGFHIGRPMPGRNLVDWAENRRRTLPGTTAPEAHGVAS